jgi:hypothetical protein
MKKIAAVVALLLVLAGTGTVSARRNVVPILLGIEGYVTQKPADPGSIMGHWTVSVSGKIVDFYVTKLDVLTGNTSYMDIFSQLEPYTPSLTLNASAAQKQQFAGAGPGKKVSMRAYLRRDTGSRRLMVETLEVQP